MAFASPTTMRYTASSLRYLASSSRFTLHHPIPTFTVASRSISSSPARFSAASAPLKATTPRLASVAQHRPADTAAYEAVPAPAYISPVGNAGAKETRKRPRAQKAAISMVSQCRLVIEPILGDRLRRTEGSSSGSDIVWCSMFSELTRRHPQLLPTFRPYCPTRPTRSYCELVSKRVAAQEWLITSTMSTPPEAVSMKW